VSHSQGEYEEGAEPETHAMKMTRWQALFAAWVCAALGVGTLAGQVPALPTADRFVLVELFTSQGCDLCPEAESLLGALAAPNRRLVPIAWHVDYFNTPWPDPYSNPLYSERQMAYDKIYVKPKPASYGLYYTPMLMIDGAQSVNGRDRAAAEAAIRQALLRPPTVALSAALQFKTPPTAADLQVWVGARSPLAQGRNLLVGAVLRDDGVTNRVLSGENANKTLIARFPARHARFEYLTLDGPATRTLNFTFQLDPAWATNRLRVAVFVQDSQTGLTHQALDLPWRPITPRRAPN
jgi:hypothetical protein